MAEKETKTVDTKVEQVNVDLNDIFNLHVCPPSSLLILGLHPYLLDVVH